MHSGRGSGLLGLRAVRNFGGFALENLKSSVKRLQSYLDMGTVPYCGDVGILDFSI